MAVDRDQLVRIWSPRDEWEATAICAALKEHGIPCHFFGELFMYDGVDNREIYVRRCDAERARKFIEDHDWPHYAPR
jgi:hypothetical protein